MVIGIVVDKVGLRIKIVVSGEKNVIKETGSQFNSVILAGELKMVREMNK